MTDLKVSLNPNYRMLICTIKIILTINKYAHITLRRVGAAWARVALPRGLACHVAPTWVPREIKTLFALFLIHF